MSDSDRPGDLADRDLAGVDVRGADLEGEDGSNTYRVKYRPECERGQFVLSAGTWRTESGRALSAAEILDDERWRAHLRKADCEWLVPYLRRIADGEDVPPAEIHTDRESDTNE